MKEREGEEGSGTWVSGKEVARIGVPPAEQWLPSLVFVNEDLSLGTALL
jgi:hypothetical protein